MAQPGFIVPAASRDQSALPDVRHCFPARLAILREPVTNTSNEKSKFNCY
jgi:hypothetical protein